MKSGNGFVTVDYESGQESSMVKKPGLRLLKMGRYRPAQIAERLKRAQEAVALSLRHAAAPD